MTIETRPLRETWGMQFSATAGEDIETLDPARVIDAFDRAALLLFRGFGIDTPRFVAFTAQFCAEFLPYIGGADNGRSAVDAAGTVHTVTGPALKATVPFHGEMHYMRTKPDLLWFYCQRPAAADGETTACDGREVYARLSPGTRALFDSKPITYIRQLPRSLWTQAYGTDDVATAEERCRQNGLEVRRRADGETLITEYTTPATLEDRTGGGRVFINNILPAAAREHFGGDLTNIVRFADGSAIPKAVLWEVKEAADAAALTVDWRPGDLVMVDNLRLMHGRRAYQDPERAIFVRLCRACFRD